jgi:hypothetical protein
MEAAKNFTDYLQVLLRYIASGIVTVMLIVYVHDKSLQFCSNYLEKSPWAVLVLAGTIGVLIYAIHHSVLDKLFYALSIFIYRCRRKVPVRLIEAVKTYHKATSKSRLPAKGNENYWRLKFALFTQCYLRRSSKVDFIVSIQQEVDKKLALLNFLYCCFYSFSGIVIAFLYNYYFDTAAAEKFNSERVYQIAIGAVILLFGAVCYDYEITKREFWLIENWFQETPHPDKEKLLDDTLPHRPEEQVINIINIEHV